MPICAAGGFDGDDRVVYDTPAGRWVLTALRVFANTAVATDLVAVSQTSDPTAGWSLYQFPACGAFDTWDGSGQPHTGFNSQWIVVDSACCGTGAGLAVV